MKNKLIYLIGSLRNPSVPAVGQQLRDAGFSVFDDWFAAGPEADDYWRIYERGRGKTLTQALRSPAAIDVFEFDRKWLMASHATVLLMPAGKSGHLEFGWTRGLGKPGFIYIPEGEEDKRWDVMYQFATSVATDMSTLVDELETALL